MKRPKNNMSAQDLWSQIFNRMKDCDNSSVWDETYDPSHDENKLREGLTNAGWQPTEVEERVNASKELIINSANAPPGVNPMVYAGYNILCVEIESAMARLGLNSHELVAHGIEPRTGPVASKTNVIMTDESIVTIGAHLFRYCGLIARAFTRTLYLNPYFWSGDAYNQSLGENLLRQNPTIIMYWMRIYNSYAVTGTNAFVPFLPAQKHELMLFEQVANAMEIFAIAHEYGHHEHNHGRSILSNESHSEEFEADQFALRISNEVDKSNKVFSNPYLTSGAGGSLLLSSLSTLRSIEEIIERSAPIDFGTHPTPHERISRFDSVAAVQPQEFQRLKEFRTTVLRIMTVVDSILVNSLRNADLSNIREISSRKFKSN